MIVDREVRVIGSDGAQLGIMSGKEAQNIASESNLDLVKISPKAVPPVCKIMDYGKFKFEQTKKEKEAKKNQKVIVIKEIQLSMNIDVNDLNIKAKHAQRFLKDGQKVKVSIRMRGRENSRADMGVAVMARFCEMLKEDCTIESPAKVEGRNINMMLAPTK